MNYSIYGHLPPNSHHPNLCAPCIHYLSTLKKGEARSYTSFILYSSHFQVGPAQSDSRMNYSIYGRMGILLKTLVSVTRVTPAYRMARRQGPDSYTINYKIYVGDPQLDSLGECWNRRNIVFFSFWTIRYVAESTLLFLTDWKQLVINPTIIPDLPWNRL